MSKAFSLKAVLLGGMLGLACQTQASLIENGSFESGLTGWTYNDVDLINSWDGSDGDYSIDLSGSSWGGWDYVYQDIATDVGDSYRLTFDYSANPGFDPLDPVKALERSFLVGIGGVLSQTFTYDLDTDDNGLIDISPTNMQYTSASIDFVTTASTTQISFNSNEYYRAGIALDNVTLNKVSVPAPAPLGLLALGLAGFLAARRRRQA